MPLPLQLLDGRPAFSITEGTTFLTLEDYAGFHVALVDKEGLSSRGFWSRVLDTSGDGMVPVRELFESVMVTFKEKEWESVSFDDFLQQARDKLGCDDSTNACGGIPWERIMALTNGRHAAVFLDCLISANRFGQHEQEPHLAWKARGEGDPTIWATYITEKIRRSAELSNGASHEGDARGGDEGWGQGGEELVCGGAGEHGAVPRSAEDDLEAGIGGGPCNGDTTECEAESVPEKHQELVFVTPGPRPVGIMETGNDLHVCVYEEDFVEQPTPESESAIYFDGPHHDAAHHQFQTYECHQQLAYDGHQELGAYQGQYHQQLQ